MNSQRMCLFLKALKALDLLVMAACFTAACVLSSDFVRHLSLRELFFVQIKIYSAVFFVYVVATWSVLLSAFHLYDYALLARPRDAALNIVKATSAGTIVIYAVASLFMIQTINLDFAAIFWPAVTALTLSSRLIIGRKLATNKSNGTVSHNVLIAGTNRHALNCVREIEDKAVFGYSLLGFVDDRSANCGECLKTGYGIVADFDGLPQYLRSNVVDEVVICLPMKSCYEKAARIVEHCEEQGVIVRHMADLFNHKVARQPAAQTEKETFVTLFNGTLSEWRALVKRGLDIAVSAAMLAALSPLFLVTAALIKLTSPGPVFFSQVRLGVNKRRFRMFKFRTMVPDAEKKQAELESLNEVDGPAFKIKNDPRITRTGKFLRKTSIDELPQLFNVLIGDMSLVGPRPLPVRDYEGFDKDWHRRRFSVRPGITCLWQISGRSNISFDKWMELDMKYIDNWSILLDLVILTKTIPAVIKGKGAE